MLFYNFNSLDNFIRNNFIENLTQENENIKRILNLYSNKKNVLSNVITTMVEMSDHIEKNKLNDFHDTVSLLKKSLEELNEIEITASKLIEDINSTISIYDHENNENEIKANLVEYNKKSDILFNNILNFENTNNYTLNSVFKVFSKEFYKKSIKSNTIIENYNPSKVNIETEPYDYNNLVVSEKSQKAYLPFFYKDVKKIYEKSKDKYKTMQDVVDNLYVVPLDKFKNSSISRFRESFNLIRNKEHGSILNALDLGLELMFKYELNPIIISACRNLDELDIYLDCLEHNELNSFKCFEIKFEVMPQILEKDLYNKRYFY